MNTNQGNNGGNSPAEVFARFGAPHIVYVRELHPDETATIPGAPAGIKLFAIHAADGTRVGVMDDRDTAFAAARQNDMEPLSVH
jgi:hypothetical protein